MTSTQNAQLGGKVRSLRRRQGLTQKQLAERLSISASYLNLIEHNRRPLSANLLIKLAQLFELDLGAFAADDDARLTADMMEALGDPIFDAHELTQGEVKEFVSTSPGIARAVASLYNAFCHTRDAAAALENRIQGETDWTSLDSTRLPSEEVSDLIDRNQNYFPDLEEAALRFRREAGLDVNRYPAMVEYLKKVHQIKVDVLPVGAADKVLRRFDPERRQLTLSEMLPPRSRHFQVAHQIGLLTCSEVIDRITRDQRLTKDGSRTLSRVALANYFAGAVLMPYQPFQEAAVTHRYDVELIGHRFRTSFEQVCHRLTTLRRPGMEGVPFHMIRVDIAGNISKRFSGSGIRFARYAGACPKWNVHAAFLTPGTIRVQLSRMPDETIYFCIARTVHKDSGGYKGPTAVHAIGMGCSLEHANKLVYSDGIDLENVAAAVPVGVTCRLCDRMDCQQRAFPPLQHPLKVNENRRGINFYAPVDP